MFRGKSLKLLKIFAWVMLIATAGIIFYFSHESQSKTLETSAFLTDPFVDFFESGKELDDYEAWSLQKKVITTIRKFAHFLEFAQFGFFLCMVLVLYRVKYPWPFAVLGSTIYAASDEIHQLIMKTRQARVVDVLVDAAGAMCGAALLLLLVFLWKKWRRNRIERKAEAAAQIGTGSGNNA